MADKKISALTAGSALGGTEKIPMVQSSSTVYTTPAALKTYLDAYYGPLKPQCEWRADTYAGYGGTDTKIPYFTNVRSNVDTAGAITVVNNSTNGCKVTINIADFYTVNFCFNVNSGTWVGISKDSSQLTTSIQSITDADRIGIAYAATTVGPCVSARVYCAVNTVLRPHTEGTAAQTNGLCSFSITRG